MTIFQDLLTLEHKEETRSRYSAEWQPDDHHLLRVGNPRLHQHSYHSLQLELWLLGEVEWFVIIRADAHACRHQRKGCLLVLQPSLPFDGTAG
ncbi:hypothetical protein [Dictyobacter halimunensis]|uniref:hypothetical protein n=1 Tax=Dictyobacter halimunensis TaxID=3026934 RepID=UPI0030C6D15A